MRKVKQNLKAKQFTVNSFLDISGEEIKQLNKNNQNRIGRFKLEFISHKTKRNFLLQVFNLDVLWELNVFSNN